MSMSARRNVTAERNEGASVQADIRERLQACPPGGCGHQLFGARALIGVMVTAGRTRAPGESGARWAKATVETEHQSKWNTERNAGARRIRRQVGMSADRNASIGQNGAPGETLLALGSPLDEPLFRMACLALWAQDVAGGGARTASLELRP